MYNISFSKKFESSIDYSLSYPYIISRFHPINGYPNDLVKSIHEFKFPNRESNKKEFPHVDGYFIQLLDSASVISFKRYIKEIGLRFGTSYEFLLFLFSNENFWSYIQSKRYSGTNAFTILGDYQTTKRIVELSLGDNMSFRDRANQDNYLEDMKPLCNHEIFIVKSS